MNNQVSCPHTISIATLPWGRVIGPSRRAPRSLVRDRDRPAMASRRRLATQTSDISFPVDEHNYVLRFRVICPWSPAQSRQREPWNARRLLNTIKRARVCEQVARRPANWLNAVGEHDCRRLFVTFGEITSCPLPRSKSGMSYSPHPHI